MVFEPEPTTMVVAPALMATSSVKPGRALLDQLFGSVQFTPSPPPSQNTAAGVVRCSSVCRRSGTARRKARAVRAGRGLPLGACHFESSVRSIGTSFFVRVGPRAPRTAGHALGGPVAGDVRIRGDNGRRSRPTSADGGRSTTE